MGRARGSNAKLYYKVEASYGVSPGGNFKQLPFVQCNLGPEQGLIESDLLGQGRESYDPTLDVINNVGDVTVPVDARGFGYWLRLLLGDPVVTTGTGVATGSIKFSAQPVVNSTITINGVVFTAVASGATATQFNIGASLSATLDNMVTALNASVNASVTPATYSKTGALNDTLTVTFDLPGITGNAFTLAASTSPVSNGTVSGPTLTGGTAKHTFTSGAPALKSASIETAKPDVPSYEMNLGARANTLKIDLQRRGLLNAVIGLIAQGANAPAGTSGVGTPVAISPARFGQATGQVKKDGAQLGAVVNASLAYSNNLETIETIRPDGLIEDADPGMATASGNVTVKFQDQIMLNAATSNTPIALSFGWTFGTFNLTFNFARVMLPRPKLPISGPNGIQASFDWQGSGAGGNVMTVVLETDIADFTV